jgi:hypothetical protein
MGEWTRRDIEEHVDVLREHNDGPEFAAAVERFAVELDDEEREQLREIILDRLGQHARKQTAFDRELAQGGFLKRTLRRLDARVPRPPK